ncbi:MAG: hypothetical protein ACI4RN_05025 [Oscillospiraceae bacterium]
MIIFYEGGFINSDYIVKVGIFQQPKNKYALFAMLSGVDKPEILSIFATPFRAHQVLFGIAKALTDGTDTLDMSDFDAKFEPPEQEWQ